MSDHDLEIDWTDERGENVVIRHLYIKFSCGHRGLRYGYFNPITGDGEGPSGPEIEVLSIEEKIGGEWKPVDDATRQFIFEDDWFYNKMADVVDDQDRDGPDDY